MTLLPLVLHIADRVKTSSSITALPVPIIPRGASTVTKYLLNLVTYLMDTRVGLAAIRGALSLCTAKHLEAKLLL